MHSILKRLKQTLFPIKGAFIVFFLYLVYRLPQGFTYRLGLFLGRLLYKFSSKRKKVVLTNLKIAFPQLNQQEIDKLAYKSSQQSGILLMEFPLAWFGQQAEIEQQILKVFNTALINEPLNNQQSVIVVMPHLGNWEILVQWIQINFPMVGLYSPSKIPQMDKVLYSARSKFGGNPYPSNNKGILRLLRSLKQGGLMIILPDQVPKGDGGTYSPFFGQPAYTMTLLHKFIQKTQSKVVFACCIRSEEQRGFQINLEKPIFEIGEKDPMIFNAGLNHQLEQMIKKNPEQYVWDYKRYKRQQDGRDFYKRDFKN